MPFSDSAAAASDDDDDDSDTAVIAAVVDTAASIMYTLRTKHVYNACPHIIDIRV
jgi:hypothetical protein